MSASQKETFCVLVIVERRRRKNFFCEDAKKRRFRLKSSLRQKKTALRSPKPFKDDDSKLKWYIIGSEYLVEGRFSISREIFSG